MTAPYPGRLIFPSLLISGTVAAQSTPFSYDHVRKVVNVGAPDVSPDGRQVVFTVTRSNYDLNRTETTLWLAALERNRLWVEWVRSKLVPATP
jgi:dipeptidyl aminopeptidase/acylaminoacyl peptidase